MNQPFGNFNPNINPFYQGPVNPQASQAANNINNMYQTNQGMMNQNPQGAYYQQPYVQANQMTGCPSNTKNVVNKYFVEEVPHVVNHHTHVVNTCIKKHVFIPCYTNSEETVYVNQCGNNRF